MYAIGFINGRSPCGNDGTQQLHHKSLKGIMKELTYMKRRVDEICIMPDFTQKMCEMDQEDFYNHCMRSKKYYIRGEIEWQLP